MLRESDEFLLNELEAEDEREAIMAADGLGSPPDDPAPPLEVYINDDERARGQATASSGTEFGKLEQPSVEQVLDEAGDTRLVSLSELAAKPVAVKVPLVKDLLFPGAWLLLGRPKIGKSWLILQMALAIAEAGAFLGFECQAPGPEVYLRGR
jgi:hypothetical protein